MLSCRHLLELGQFNNYNTKYKLYLIINEGIMHDFVVTIDSTIVS